MIFHASALSSYSAKVRVVLCVKGLEFEECAPAQGYRSPEYRAVVPMSTLPAIQIGDWVLSESEVINEYLEDRYPEPAMLPQDPEQRARVRFLCRFHDLYLEPKVRALYGQVKPATRNPETILALQTDIEFRLKQLAAWVQPQPFLLTPSISLADCGFLVTLPLASMVLAACGNSLILPPVLAHWLSVASAHPPVERALAPWRAATQAWLSS
jgi:glutathione S-transferase